MYIGHVGDSRCYRVRGGQIQLLTRDHSLINDYLLAMPDLTDEQKSELPKNVITRALGMQDQVVVDLQHDDPLHGRRLHPLLRRPVGHGHGRRHPAASSRQQPDIREACKRLIQRANERGGEDNITAVLIKIEETPDESPVDGDTEERLAKSKSAPPPAEEEDDEQNFAEEPTMPGITPDKPSKP